MKIVVRNCSSPGASFTENTNKVLLSVYDWIRENNFPTLLFKELREVLEREKNINNNNSRNIYPMVKQCGMISYKKGMLDTNEFFTNTGLAYVKTLEMKRQILQGGYSEQKKQKAMAKVEKVITLQIYDGLKELLSAKTNYRENMLDLISYLERFDKINREEFAYLLFVEQQGTGVDFNTMSSVIQDYRNQLLEIEVSVDVRNDIKIREDTKKDRRKEPIGFLSAFHYFTSLLSQAGLLEKEDKGNYYKCIKNRKNDLIKLR